MNLIKLNAIDSTSLFLKELAKNNELENFTTVVADVQSDGVGQMNTKWHSADGKNLLFTTYVCLKELDIKYQPLISFLVATKLAEVLKVYLNNHTKIQVKWPNDIMSYNDKLAGILVENVIKNGRVASTFIGIGLNVNQLSFPSFLSNVTSMSLITGLDYSKEVLLEAILNEFESVVNKEYILSHQEQIKKDYMANLYKLKTPSMFRDQDEEVFMGKIIDVTPSGLLKVEKEDELIYDYAVKEITFL
ncbi:biotin--[acetyl-CoA-carboxylase] ligase [Wenyingzhuangia sp. IMCC45533]